ncbi:MAG: UTRA domain-containing protein [Thermogemmatispora sp.]|uniref:UTRA domain-containing protein n=1 Tax=Thermogemmatispora sp. TaxID=1968838 RepID=UPI00260427F7|nr:UTRA domain-containing protein [Thermogemmatispora sp.]MBX5458382.1 UTRA domain-containing protein [Thermogemmatispora sp.]
MRHIQGQEKSPRTPERASPSPGSKDTPPPTRRPSSLNFYNPDLITDQIFSQLQADPFFNTWTALRRTSGIEIVTSRNRAFVRLPTVEEQSLLEITREMPVLELRRVQLTGSDLPVMVNRLIFVSGRFELFFEASPA